MQELRSTSDLIVNSANEFWQAIGAYLPQLLGAIILIILGAIVAKLADSLTRNILRFFGAEKVGNNKTVAKTMKKAGLDIDLIATSGKIVFWIVIVIFALAIADVLGLNAMRDVIRELLAYLPNVIAAAIVLTVTVAGARLVGDALTAALARMSVDYAGGIGKASKWAIILFGTLMAVDQLGFDITIIAANITIIVGGVVLAFALAFGLGGREVAGKILERIYNVQNKN